MQEYKENFKNAIHYATHKLENPPLKLILLGVLGSIYVGIAYMVFILILSTWPGAVTPEVNINGEFKSRLNISIPAPALFTAASLFPVGIILILFLGGSLFTSDNLTMIAWITKQKDINGKNIKLSKIAVKWILTLVGNLLGGLIFGALTRASSFLSSENAQYILGYLCGKKITLKWYYTIFSGFLCNILVAGSVWSTLASKHSTAKIFLVYFPIWLFAISGFQHVVANGILFSMGLFYMINPNEQHVILSGINFAYNHHWFVTEAQASISNLKQSKLWVNPGYFVVLCSFNNLIPAAFGNWISGSLFLPYCYYFLSNLNKQSA